VGVVLEGGDEATVDGLREELKELGLAEGRNYTLDVRNLRGVRDAAEAASRSLAQAKVDVIFSIATSVTTLVKRETSTVPVVFAVGSDPVAAGLVESFAHPGGRFTGVYYSTRDLAPKRLDILRAMLPNLRKVVTFYDPGNPFAVASLISVRQAARQLGVEVVERRVANVEELRRAVAAFKPQDADALFYTNDAMVRSQSRFIIDTMRAKRVPTMFSWPDLAAEGALAGYGVSFREVGQLAARYVQKILDGASPASLPVESVSRLKLAVNLVTAREIGVTIPQAVRLSAGDLIE